MLEPFLRENPQAPFLKWRLHSALYLRLLEESFRALPDDPIGRGACLRVWESRCNDATDFCAEHAVAVLELCDRYRPMQVLSQGVTQEAVTRRFKEWSSQGKLGSHPTDLEQVVDALPQSLGKIKRDVLAAWVVDQVQPCDEGAVGFVDPTREAVLMEKLKSGRLRRFLGDFLCDYLQKVPEQVFWQALKNETKATCPVRFFKTIQSICIAIASGAKVNLARDMAFEWCEMHMRFQPSKIDPVSDTYKESLADWRLWRSSYFGVITPLVSTAASRHEKALERCAPLGLSRATLWVGFSRVLMDLQVDGVLALHERGPLTNEDLALELMSIMLSVEFSSYRYCGSFETCRLLAEKVSELVQKYLLPALSNVSTSISDPTMPSRHATGIVLCSKKHQTRVRICSSSGCKCTSCGCRIDYGEQLNYCWLCDWDVCHRCSGRSKKASSFVDQLVQLCSKNWADRPQLLVMTCRFIHCIAQSLRPSPDLVKNPWLEESHIDADGRTIRKLVRADTKSREKESALIMNGALFTVIKVLCKQGTSLLAQSEPPQSTVAGMALDELQQELELMWNWFDQPKWMLELRDGRDARDVELPGKDVLLLYLERIRAFSTVCPNILEGEKSLLIQLGKILVQQSEYEYAYHWYFGQPWTCSRSPRRR